jgi:hypothetical protein
LPENLNSTPIADAHAPEERAARPFPFQTRRLNVPSIHAKNGQRTTRGNSMLRHFWRLVNRQQHENIFNYHKTE